MLLDFPVFHRSSASVYYTERTLKNKNEGGLGMRLLVGVLPVLIVMLVLYLVLLTRFLPLSRQYTAVWKFFTLKIIHLKIFVMLNLCGSFDPQKFYG